MEGQISKIVKAWEMGNWTFYLWIDIKMEIVYNHHISKALMTLPGMDHFTGDH